MYFHAYSPALFLWIVFMAVLEGICGAVPRAAGFIARVGLVWLVCHILGRVIAG